MKNTAKNFVKNLSIKPCFAKIGNFFKGHENIIVFVTLLGLLVAYWMLFYKHSIHADYWITGHDEDNFLSRSVFFQQTLMSGEWLPQWSSAMRSGYGSPFHLFYGKWTFYLAEFFKLLQFSDTNSWIAVCIFSYWISGIAFYLFLRLFVDKISSLAGMMIFCFFPAHLAELIVRTDPPQALSAYGFIVFAFYFGVRFIREKTVGLWIWAVLFGMLSITTHTLSSAMWFPVLAVFLLLTCYQEKAGWPIFWSLITAGFASVFLAGAYILPLLFSQELVHIDILFTSGYTEPAEHINSNFLTFQYINSWTHIFNTDQFYSQHPSLHGEKLILALPLGIGSIFIALAAIPYLFSKKISKSSRHLLQFFMVLFLFGTYLNTFKNSEVIWNLDFMHVFQFSWRILPWIAFAIAIMASILAQTLYSKKSGNVGLIISFFSLIWIAGYPIMKDTVWMTEDSPKYDRMHYPLRSLAQRVDPQHNEGYFGTAGEYVPKTVSNEFDRNPDQSPKQLVPADWTTFNETAPGNIVIKKHWRDGNIFTFTLDSPVRQVVTFDQFYFPGWKAYALNPSNKYLKTEIPLKASEEGLIQFEMPYGVDMDIKIVFEGSFVTKTGKWITYISLVLILSTLYYRKKLNKWLQRK